MTIKLFRLPRYAPCGFILARAQADGTFDPYGADTVLIQTDWDFPGVAGTFGASLQTLIPGDCDHDGTDGTVTCPGCKKTASDFISAAYDWLADNDGATADDPGYFGG